MLSVNNRDLKNNIIFAGIQSTFWCANCIYFSFLINYLLSCGYSEILIGTIMSMLALISFVSPLVSGYLSDYIIPVQRLVVIFMAISIPASLLLRTASFSVVLVFVSVACMGFFTRSLISVIDSWSVKLLSRNVEINYGATRAFASFSYATTAVVAGYCFSKIGMDSLFPAYIFFALGTCVFSGIFLPVPVVKKERGSTKSNIWVVIRKLFFRKSFVFFVLGMLSNGFSLVLSTTFKPQFIQSMGGTTAEVGYSLFIGCMGEIPAMLLSKKLSGHFQNYNIVLFSIALNIVQMILHATAGSLKILIMIQFIQGFSFGIYLPSVLKCLKDITPENCRGLAITSAFAISEGTTGMIGNLLGSFIAAKFNIRCIYYIFACLSIGSYISCMYSRYCAEQKR